MSDCFGDNCCITIFGNSTFGSCCKLSHILHVNIRCSAYWCCSIIIWIECNIHTVPWRTRVIIAYEIQIISTFIIITCTAARRNGICICECGPDNLGCIWTQSLIIHTVISKGCSFFTGGWCSFRINRITSTIVNSKFCCRCGNIKTPPTLAVVVTIDIIHNAHNTAVWFVAYICTIFIIEAYFRLIAEIPIIIHINDIKLIATYRIIRIIDLSIIFGTCVYYTFHCRTYKCQIILRSGSCIIRNLIYHTAFHSISRCSRFCWRICQYRIFACVLWVIHRTARFIMTIIQGECCCICRNRDFIPFDIVTSQFSGVLHYITCILL